jgi:hypothetical protein
MNVVRTSYFLMMMAFATTIALASDAAKPEPAQPVISANNVNQKWIVEGQKRYQINCGRCHQPPHLFSSREMAMAVRHMRVRAMLTQEDMNYLLYYMSHQ